MQFIVQSWALPHPSLTCQTHWWFYQARSNPSCHVCVPSFLCFPGCGRTARHQGRHRRHWQICKPPPRPRPLHPITHTRCLTRLTFISVLNKDVGVAVYGGTHTEYKLWCFSPPHLLCIRDPQEHPESLGRRDRLEDGYVCLCLCVCVCVFVCAYVGVCVCVCVRA